MRSFNLDMAAWSVSVSRRTIYSWIAQGVLPSTGQFGGRRVSARDVLSAWGEMQRRMREARRAAATRLRDRRNQKKAV